MENYSLSEIYQLAIRIEENGEAAYNYFASIFKDEEIKKIFLFLAKEEVDHKHIFENMLSHIEDYSSSEQYPPEYFLYIRAFADSVVFTKEKFRAEIHKIVDIMAAIDFAMKRELDTINYYHTLKSILAPKDHPGVDEIIKQEKGHFLRLYNYKQKFE